MNFATPTSNRHFVPARENPLAVERVSNLHYRFESGNWKSHLGRLEKLNFRAGIIGPQGSGKTTLLAELHSCLEKETGNSSHYVFLPHEKTYHAEMVRDAHRSTEQGHILLIDGFERLGFWTRMRILKATKNKAGLILNLHRPLRGAFRLPKWIECRTSPELLIELLEELLDSHDELQTEAIRLFKMHQGNIRMVLRDLYDQIANGELILQQHLSSSALSTSVVEI